jgi:DNA repair protein RadC
MTSEEKPHYHGHRARLRQRFLEGGVSALADYELLELLLFLAQPRGDVKPIAKKLLSTFGNFAQIMAAQPHQLKQVPGVAEASIVALKTVQAAALLMVRQTILLKPIMSSWDQVIEYCRLSMEHSSIETFWVLFLDQKNRLMSEELQQKGTVNQTSIYPREVMKRALELGACAVILVHNHPSGDPTPSEADIRMTHLVVQAGKTLNVSVHDHIIIGKGGAYKSFKDLGLL